MNCVDFEDQWNRALDARGSGPSELEGRLEAHAASCDSCRAISARYRRLRRAVDALEAPRAPSAESASRLLALMAAAPVPAARSPIRMLARWAWVPLSAAAALLLIVGPGGFGPRGPIVPADSTSRPLAPVSSPRPLGSALAEARTASIELAREVSAPAARIGLEVLADRDGGESLAAVPDRPDVDGLAGPASDLIQSVGERLSASVGPISGSARHAFGFLLGPPPPSPSQKSL